MKDRFRRFRKTIWPYYYEKGFNPFSKTFDQKKVQEYISKLDSKLSNPEIEILKQFKIFNDYHNKLFLGLETEVDRVTTTRDHFCRALVALSNEQYFAIKKEMRENLKHNNASALDFKNVTIETEKFPNNPQVLNGLLENTIEFLNLLLNYGKRKKFKTTVSKISEKEIVESYEAIFKNANEYHELKHHFETCLSGSGKIICEEGKIIFDTTDTRLNLSQILMEVIIENNSQFSYFSFMNHISTGSGIIYLSNEEHNLILDDLRFINGEWEFVLRERKDSELISLYLYEVFIKDYYPHITEIDLQNLEGLTLRDLLHLSQSLSEFGYRIIDLLDKRKTEENIDSIMENYAPLIPCEFICQYLISVSGLSKKQVDKYLEIQTNSLSDNLYARPLIKMGQSYIFPFLPVTAFNYFFLLDHWLEVADISLNKRGLKFQDIVRDELKDFKDEIYNKYKVIDEEKIYCTLNGQEVMEEIDLIVELRDAILIGEVKCIKYPMSERDCFDGLNDRVDEAIKQLLRKQRYLIKNAEEIKSRYKFDAKKKIIKVVVLNYPVYTCYSVKGIPIVDYKTLLSYFHSSGYSLKSMNEKEIEVVTSGKYYTCEDTFNSNLENYLVDAPTHSYFKSGMDLRELIYKLPFLGVEVTFNDYRKR